MNHTAPLVRATNLSKRFKIYPKPNGRLIEWLTGGRVQRHADFWALRGLDMTLYRGECLGIVGANGSGKSTFLKILAGTLTPTSGSCSVDGKVMAILELGTGFNRELTGRQNIHLAAQLLGIGADYVNQKMPDIEAFAALGEFMDRPIKLYSSGMQARLAFSLFAFLEPDVLIVDEALAVGDISFQRKCYRHMEQMIGSGRQAVIFVTHDLHAVTKLCTRAIWLRNGHVELEGEPPEVVERYQRFMLNGEEGIATTASRRPAVSLDESGVPQSGRLARCEAAVLYPSGGAEVLGLWLELEDGTVTQMVRAGKPFRICYALRFVAPAMQPVFGTRVTTARGDVLIGINTKMTGVITPDYALGDVEIVRWPVMAGLAAGDYFISCGCSLYDDPLHFLAREVDAYRFAITGAAATGALCNLTGAPLLAGASCTA
ncbi:MAG TPA: ABC transporter ATP-binding protein [Tepidisphaeraceae bacterium]|nr:ABC transporter ATP-binding protein [Tepidisphaeraceae bacterium]